MGLSPPTRARADPRGGGFFPKSRRQRCLAPKIRKLVSKVPAQGWREVKARALAAD